ncbi:MAG: 2'-deoxycytidine 5'-triphosphate deaminase [bacterium]|nr:MAG: 2'-deoxycytidine 5'-triphosphate deaminase [bacterium]
MYIKASDERLPGVLPIQELKDAVAKKYITAVKGITKSQFQPSSMDLRLGPKAYRIRSSFLPQRRKIAKTLKELLMYEIDLTGSAILERGNVYLIPLLESMNLPDNIRGRANPKSSVGRLDIFTRVISDYTHRFEDIDAGYEGMLFLEVVPRSFTVRVKTGLCLNQLRLFRGNAMIDDRQLAAMHANKPLLYNGLGKKVDPKIKDGIYVSIEITPRSGRLSGRRRSGGNSAVKDEHVVGYMAKKNSAVIDLTRTGSYSVRDFWEQIKSPHENFLILEPEEFYIFASKEKIRVPMDCAAEMVEFDAGSGELRTHYAGFFDSGFGAGPEKGTKAVMEVRPHDVPFRVEDGQLFFKLRYEKMAQPPVMGYGKPIGSSYHNQGLTLSKHFVMGKDD